MATYLDFELKIKTLQENIATAQLKGDTHAIEILQKDLEKEVERVYSNLSDYQKLQLARHPDRPYAMDYIGILLKDSIEIHGDRHFSDDNAIVCFLGKIDHQKVMVIGEEKEGPETDCKESWVCQTQKAIAKPCVLQKWLKNLKFRF